MASRVSNRARVEQNLVGSSVDLKGLITPRFDTSPCTPVTCLPISCAAPASSGSRRPVMNTYAPSFANCFAAARPMPLLPPVMSAILPSSLPVQASSGLACSVSPGGCTNPVSGRWYGIAEPLRESTPRSLETRPFVAIVEAGDRHQLTLVEADQRGIDHIFRRHDDRCGQVLEGQAGLVPELGRGRARQHGLDSDALCREFVLQRMAERKNVGFARAVDTVERLGRDAHHRDAQ